MIYNRDLVQTLALKLERFEIDIKDDLDNVASGKSLERLGVIIQTINLLRLSIQESSLFGE